MIRFLTIVCLCLLQVYASASRRSHSNSQPTSSQVKLFDEFLINAVYNGDISGLDVGLVSPLSGSQSDGSRSSRGQRLQATDRRQESDDDSTRSTRRHHRHGRHGRRNRNSDPSTDSSSDIDLSAILSGNSTTANPSSSSVSSIISSRRLRSRLGETSSRRAGQSVRDADLSQMNRLTGIPRAHWSCCNLGQLAGDKGFLCNAQFYASRVTSRLANRVHNRRMSTEYFDNLAPTTQGAQLVELFNSCVTSSVRGEEFELCCQQVTDERQQLRQLSDDFVKTISIL